MGIWARGHLGTWASGYVGIWVRGHLGTWASGHVIIALYTTLPPLNQIHNKKLIQSDHTPNLPYNTHFQNNTTNNLINVELENVEDEILNILNNEQNNSELDGHQTQASTDGSLNEDYEVLVKVLPLEEIKKMAYEVFFD